MNAGGMLNTCKSDGKHGKRCFQWRTGLNPGQAVETTKLEYGRGRGNFRWSGEMRRDRKEHQVFFLGLNRLLATIQLIDVISNLPGLRAASNREFILSVKESAYTLSEPSIQWQINRLSLVLFLALMEACQGEVDDLFNFYPDLHLALRAYAVSVDVRGSFSSE
ncbi:hypothetical protein CQW23_33824 [Capsicum baccatum]|uniref:Uncharacterized protein n=1 Tax=Capsicum baccatum TaxID=33114 RepID=A0A2G2V0L7_CAPBA|nr:hypothetical protein CQW23_33824 [Capsicum baccatum]